MKDLLTIAMTTVPKRLGQRTSVQFREIYSCSEAVVNTKSKEPPEPAFKHETVRRDMLSILTQGRRSARELSSEIGISEKEVYGHLDHLRRSMAKSGRHLIVTPAECRKCGFVFSKRERLKKPGKCPVCKEESIREPLFAVEERP